MKTLSFGVTSAFCGAKTQVSTPVCRHPSSFLMGPDVLIAMAEKKKERKKLQQK
jgi:hypothetical protein